MIAALALKITLTAILALVIIQILDALNGTGGRYQNSPMWIAVPGVLAGLVIVVGFIITVVALVWGF